MPTIILESHSVEETRHIGEVLADALEPGDVISLIGDLGAGKTHLVQSITAGLGATNDLVHSPTFVLIQEYTGRLQVYHFDAYRLRDVDEFLELGADELLGAEGVCLIEWADRVQEVLPKDHLQIQIVATAESSRQLTLTPSGPRSRELLQNFELAWDSDSH